jgi:uncharacterized damage-inducible protein DinB
MLIETFQMLARYNALANQRLYEVCALLSDAERKQTRPAFFKSIHGTLNHIMVCDRIWMGRFQGQEISSQPLDTILYEDFAELRGARVKEDEQIEAFMANLTFDFLKGTITCKNQQGTIYTEPANLLITHFFNHQTHHRGQIHNILSQTEIPPPVLDLPRLLKV